MKIRITSLFIYLMCVFSINAQSPEFSWVSTAPANSGWPLTIDSDNNIYTAGYSVISINKFDENGNHVWNIQMPNGKWNDAYALEADLQGHIYVTGEFLDTVDFDPGTGVDERIAPGNYDLFLQKIDTAGNHIWVNSFGGNDHEQGIDVEISPSGNLYSTGWFKDTIDFSTGGPAEELISTATDTYVLKTDTDGNTIWAYGTEAISGSVRCSFIETDSEENVYVVGRFTNEADFEMGSGTTSITASGDGGFILKLDSSGTFQWVKHIAGHPVYISTLSIDPEDNLVVSGNFGDSIDVDPGAGASYLYTNGLNDAFVAKYSHDGDLQWAHSFGDTDADYAECVDTDNMGNVYVTGSFQSSPDFDPGSSSTMLSSNGDQDIFWQAFDKHGNFLWAKSAGGTAKDIPNKIEIDHNQHIVSVGRFNDSVNFHTDGDTASFVASGNKLFVHKMSQCILGNGVTQNGGDFIADAYGVQYQWLDCNDAFSEISGETNQVYTPTENGSYAVEVSNDVCIDTTECITINDVGTNESNATELLVFPNPNKGQLRIKHGLSGNQTKHLQIYDLQGRPLDSITLTEAEQDVHLLLKPGTYLGILLEDGIRRAQIRIIIQ